MRTGLSAIKRVSRLLRAKSRLVVCARAPGTSWMDRLFRVEVFLREGSLLLPGSGLPLFQAGRVFLGMLHGVRFHDSQATIIEPYRLGIEAFNRGAGEDSYILGCNAPKGPSLGLVRGMRITSDIMRSLASIMVLPRKQFFRNWHFRHRINDPNYICLNEDEQAFRSPIQIRGQGGDPADDSDFLLEEKRQILTELIVIPKIAAIFRPFDFSEGIRTDSAGRRWRFLFNWTDKLSKVRINRPVGGRWKMMWHSEDGNTASASVPKIDGLAGILPRSAAVLVEDI
jgi:hypothetical protein